MSDFDDFETSLAEINRKEELGTVAALNDIDSALYFSHLTPIEPFESPEVEMPSSDPYEVYRCMGDGYEAHEVGVDEKELSLWRSTFPYLAVRGIGYFEDDGNDGIEEFETLPAGPLPETKVEDVCLSIIGHRCSIHPPHSQHSEEIFACDGVVDEVIAIDSSVDHDIASADDIALTFMNPKTCFQDEVTDILFDALLPHIAESCRPLIEKVVRIGREKGYPLIDDGEGRDGDEVRNYDSWSDF